MATSCDGYLLPLVPEVGCFFISVVLSGRCCCNHPGHGLLEEAGWQLSDNMLGEVGVFFLIHCSFYVLIS